jgi:hypothetical protein
METEGQFSPETTDEVHDRYESLGSTAQLVVKEIAKAMELSAEEYDQRVTSDVIETARDVLFAESLSITVGTFDEFDAWRSESDYEVTVLGAENVDHVVWHAAPFADQAVAATFQDKRQAAVGTLRRQAFGRIYSDLV